MTVVGALKWSGTSTVSRHSIFSHAPPSRELRLVRGGEEEEGGFSPAEAKNFSVSLYIYIYILPRDVNEETRSSVLKRIPLEGRKRGGKRGAPDGRVAPRRSTEIELSGRRVTDESLRGGMSRNVETSRLYSPFTSSKKL